MLEAQKDSESLMLGRVSGANLADRRLKAHRPLSEADEIQKMKSLKGAASRLNVTVR